MWSVNTCKMFLKIVTVIFFSLSCFTVDVLGIEYKVTGDHKWINTGNSWYTLKTSEFVSFTGTYVLLSYNLK